MQLLFDSCIAPIFVSHFNLSANFGSKHRQSLIAVPFPPSSFYDLKLIFKFLIIIPNLTLQIFQKYGCLFVMYHHITWSYNLFNNYFFVKSLWIVCFQRYLRFYQLKRTKISLPEDFYFTIFIFISYFHFSPIYIQCIWLLGFYGQLVNNDTFILFSSDSV